LRVSRSVRAAAGRESRITVGALEFASIETVKQCVVAAMGIAVWPGIAIDADLAAGRLVRLPWRETFEV
jgi:DNA-binding transcriptional LysR family regulator